MPLSQSQQAHFDQAHRREALRETVRLAGELKDAKNRLSTMGDRQGMGMEVTGARAAYVASRQRYLEGAADDDELTHRIKTLDQAVADAVRRPLNWLVS